MHRVGFPVGVATVGGLLVALGGLHGPSMRTAVPPPSRAPHTTALVTSCPSGMVPWPLAEAKMPALKNLPDGGVIDVAGTGARHFDPCSWWVSFTAAPPLGLIDQLAALRVGFGYAEDGAPTPARATPVTYVVPLGGFLSKSRGVATTHSPSSTSNR